MQKNIKIIALLTGRGNNTLRDKNILKVLNKPCLAYPCIAAKKVINGINPSEVIIYNQYNKKRGLFEKLFNFLG